MLPAPNRLRATKDIEHVIKRGRRFALPTLSVSIAPGQTTKTRATVVAGLKVHKRATVRNLLKRRLREAMRTLIPEMRTGLDIVVVARAEAVGKSFQDLGNDLYGALTRLGVIHK